MKIFGYSYPGNERLAVPDEMSLFALYGMEWWPPQDRK